MEIQPLNKFMKTIDHNNLGRLTILASFQRENKVVALGVNSKGRHWLLWGPSSDDMSNLSTTEILTEKGYKPMTSSAIKYFLQSAESLIHTDFVKIADGTLFLD